MEAVVEGLFGILERDGAARYGMESINQLEHALQCASLAEAEGAAAPLTVAALFHDIGHMIHKLGEHTAERGIDDRHEVLGGKYLSKWFHEAVTAPVLMHVDAKRYLCGTDPGYFGKLSPASVRSLGLQGGPLSGAETAAFERRPHAMDAVRLRRWDERAKVAGLKTAGLDHFRPAVASCLAAAPAGN